MAEDSGKKRKRRSLKENGRSQELPVDGGFDKMTVTYIEETAMPPVLVTSPGMNAPNISFQPYARPRSTKHSGRPVKPSTHDLLLHSSQHARLEYTATPNRLDQNLAQYVAIYDPTRRQLEITPAHRVRLQSTLRSDPNEVEEKRSYAQQREELGREFGTKKARKAIASKTENAITTDAKGKGRANDAQAAILESVGEATNGGKDMSAEAKAEALLASKPIPKPNINAETVEEVYPLDTLVPPGDGRMVFIKEWQDQTRAEEDIQFSHRFPAYRVADIGKSDDAVKLRALRYLTLLLEFHDTLSAGSREGGRKVPKKAVLTQRLDSWPLPLVDSVRRRFANDSGIELSKWHMDNLHTHMCALSLYIDGWATDISNLKDDLKMETRQISRYFTELGCHVARPTATETAARGLKKTEASATRIAKLKLPLEFPKPRTARRR